MDEGEPALQGRGPQPLWHQGPELLGASKARCRGMGLRREAVDTDEASAPRPSLASRCAARFPTGHGLVQVSGPGGWGPLL